MKKLLLSLAMICLLLTGCSKPAAPVDVELTSVMETIETKFENDLPMTMPVGEVELQDFYGMSTDMVEDYAIILSAMNVHATEIIMVEAKEGKLDDVKAALDKRMEDVERIWSTYLPDQYELVKNRKTLESGNYVAIVIAEKADEIMKVITDSLTAGK